VYFQCDHFHFKKICLETDLLISCFNPNRPTMKIIRQFLLLFFLGLSAQTASAQKHPNLDKLDVYESGGKVYITCIISAGNTCNGINVLRSDDSLEFSIIGQVSGVCGSNDFPTTYDFVDQNPILNKPSFYQLEFGGFTPSEIIRIFIIEHNSNGYQIRPQPAGNQARIYFVNSSNSEHSIILFSSSGKNLLEEKSTGDFFDLSFINIPSGLYGFRISGNPIKPSIIGKILIQH
jgi:hypothetical protein